MTEDITRRRVLTVLAAAGGVGALGGAGTYAAFSDTASTRATFTSGSLDLRVHYTTYAGAETRSDTIDGNGQRPVELFDRGDLEPGDSGRMTFCFEITTNPAYLWVCGDLTAGSDSDLADAMETTLRYCGSDGAVIGERNRSFRSVFADLAGGVPLDYDGTDAEAGEQTAYEPSSESGTTGPCLCIEWKIPEEVGNEIESDQLAFNLQFHAIQARHGDGTDSPCDSDGGDGGGGGTPTTSTTTTSDDGPNKAGISFIAFCDFNGNTESLKPSFGVLKTNDEGEPIKVHWETNKEVGHIVLKTGNQDAPGPPNKWESMFDHFYPNSKSGTVTVGTGTDVAGQHPSNPCPNGEEVKFNYKGGSFQRE